MSDVNIYKKFYNPYNRKVGCQADSSSTSSSGSVSSLAMDVSLLPALQGVHAGGYAGVKKEFSCDKCGKAFPAKQNLGTHMRRFHKNETLMCPFPGCLKTYKHRWDLTSHTNVAHKGEKVMCPNCGSCFSKKSNLYNHLHRGRGCPKRGSPSPPSLLHSSMDSPRTVSSPLHSTIDSPRTMSSPLQGGLDSPRTISSSLLAAAKVASSEEEDDWEEETARQGRGREQEEDEEQDLVIDTGEQEVVEIKQEDGEIKEEDGEIEREEEQQQQQQPPFLQFLMENKALKMPRAGSGERREAGDLVQLGGRGLEGSLVHLGERRENWGFQRERREGWGPPGEKREGWLPPGEKREPLDTLGHKPREGLPDRNGQGGAGRGVRSHPPLARAVSDPPPSGAGFLNNLELLADIAMAHSDDVEEEEQEESMERVVRVRAQSFTETQTSPRAQPIDYRMPKAPTVPNIIIQPPTPRFQTMMSASVSLPGQPQRQAAPQSLQPAPHAWTGSLAPQPRLQFLGQPGQLVGMMGGQVMMVGVPAQQVVMIPPGAQVLQATPSSGYQLVNGANPSLGVGVGLNQLAMPMLPMLPLHPVTTTATSTTSLFSPRTLRPIMSTRPPSPPAPRAPNSPSSSERSGDEGGSSGGEGSDSSSNSAGPSTSTSTPPSSQHCRCDTCGRICSDPAHLRNHIKMVHSNLDNRVQRQKTLQCSVCQKMFGRTSHLAEHIKSVHQGNRRVYQKASCHQCGRVFARKCSLNQHISAAHGGNGVQEGGERNSESS